MSKKTKEMKKVEAGTDFDDDSSLQQKLMSFGANGQASTVAPPMDLYLPEIDERVEVRSCSAMERIEVFEVGERDEMGGQVILIASCVYSMKTGKPVFTRESARKFLEQPNAGSVSARMIMHARDVSMLSTNSVLEAKKNSSSEQPESGPSLN